MLAKIRQKFVRVFLVSSVALILLGAPAIPSAYAGDCPTGTGSTAIC